LINIDHTIALKVMLWLFIIKKGDGISSPFICRLFLSYDLTATASFSFIADGAETT
jgi:hypothetical protein